MGSPQQVLLASEVVINKLVFAVLVALLLTMSEARPFVGVFGSGIFVAEPNAEVPTITSLGAQAGVYNLFGPLGLRGTAEVSVHPDFGLSEPPQDAPSYRVTELAGDALVSLGLLGVKGYVGVGGGAGTLFGVDTLQARAVAGAEVRGLFGELLPTYWYFREGTVGLFGLRARVGYNVLF